MDRKILLLILIVCLVVNFLVIIYLISPKASLTGFAVKNFNGLKLIDDSEEKNVEEKGDMRGQWEKISDDSRSFGRSRKSRSFIGSKNSGNQNEQNKIAKVFINPSIVNSKIGKDFTINVEIDTGTPVYAVDFRINFNKDILGVKKENVIEGNFLKKDGVITYPIVVINKSRIIFGNTRLKTQKGISGKGTLAKITFRPKNRGSTELDLEVMLVNSKLQEVKVLTQNGKVYVS